MGRIELARAGAYLTLGWLASHTAVAEWPTPSSPAATSVALVDLNHAPWPPPPRFGAQPSRHDLAVRDALGLSRDPYATQKGLAETRPAPDSPMVSGEKVVHWTRLPLLGDTARAQGYSLPDPLGVSAGFYMERQLFEVVDLKVGFFDMKLLDIDKLIMASDVETAQQVWTARFDAWLLPFLTVYGIAGYMDGQAKMALGPFGVPLVDLELNYDGPTFGVGGTLAGGFKPFDGRDTILFGQADVNYTKTFLTFDELGLSIPGGVDSVVISARLGLRERIPTRSPPGELHVSLWTGAMRQAVQREIPVRIDALGLDIFVEQEARAVWNGIFGGRLEIGRNFDLMLEAGFGGRQSLMLTATFRF
jgi:hypothetical protein